MRTVIVAEIGINHNNDLDTCLRLVDAAAEAGCDVAKFQLFSAKALYPASAGRLDWKDGGKSYSYDIYEAVRRFEMPLAWVDRLMAYCGDKGIKFAASVFDEAGIDFLVKRGVGLLKLSSYSITNLPLIAAAAESGLPLYMSTGGARIGEVEEAVETVLARHDRLTLLHCSIAYPTPLADCNLGVIETLGRAFPGVRLGYSDHTIEPAEAPAAAVLLGAEVIEKHITLDKAMPGPDHFFALEPHELRAMVEAVRAAELRRGAGRAQVDPLLYGSSARKCHPAEGYLRDFAYATLFAARALAKGERIRPEDILVLRPGKKPRGLDPKYLGLFREQAVTAKQDLAAEDPITWNAILS